MPATLPALAATSHIDAFDEFYRRVKERPIYLILGVQGSGTSFLCDILTRVCRASVLRDHALVVRAAHRLSSHPSSAAVEDQFRFVLRRIFPTRTRKFVDAQLIRDNLPFRG